ncbi:MULTISPECIES: hypothetical protein [unclassified Bradyrhizobium]|uniref:hypothetical protein n=1 Tax=unclassified Bradyrhizobium TaxID=2631580 RepID=UPI0003A23573|nr:MULTISPECIES: hypothetical protein [unclassified Bradyrhizobium]
MQLGLAVDALICQAAPVHPYVISGPLKDDIGFLLSSLLEALGTATLGRHHNPFAGSRSRSLKMMWA